MNHLILKLVLQSHRQENTHYFTQRADVGEILTLGVLLKIVTRKRLKIS